MKLYNAKGEFVRKAPDMLNKYNELRAYNEAGLFIKSQFTKGMKLKMSLAGIPIIQPGKAIVEAGRAIRSRLSAETFRKRGPKDLSIFLDGTEGESMGRDERYDEPRIRTDRDEMEEAGHKPSDFA